MYVPKYDFFSITIRKLERKKVEIQYTLNFLCPIPKFLREQFEVKLRLNWDFEHVADAG
jgi:hypothetical protein